MKKFKFFKFKCLLFVLLMLCTTMAFAVPDNYEALADNNLIILEESLEFYAYMDLETADIQTQEKILESRNKIIDSQSWVVEGVEGYKRDAHGNLEPLPQFYDLFPSDWNIPITQNDNIKKSTEESPLITPNRSAYYFSWETWMVLSPTSNNRPFYSIQGVYELNTGVFFSCVNTHNQRCIDVSTGATLAWVPNVTSGCGYNLIFSQAKYVSCYAASNSITADALMMVWGSV